MLSDSEIIKRVKDGRMHDFRWLIQRYHKSVYAIAYGILRKREDAEDVVQDTFIKIFKSLNTYSDDRSFWSWARRITVNCCIDRLPKDFPTEDIEQLADSQQPLINGCEAEIFTRYEGEIMDSIVAGLPVEYRIVVVLRYYDGLSTSEIAELLGIPAGTARVKLHRAIKMLSKRLAVVKDELQ